MNPLNIYWMILLRTNSVSSFLKLDSFFIFEQNNRAKVISFEELLGSNGNKQP